MRELIFSDFFSIIKYQLKNFEIAYFSITDNYKLDEFCMEYYKKFNRNPYFVNKWYAMDLFHKFFLEEISDKKIFTSMSLLEFGGGLGISAAFFAKTGFNIISTDNEFFACSLISKTLKANNCGGYVINCDWKYPPFKKKFDIITGIDIIYDKESVETVSKSFFELIKKKGILYSANFTNYAFGLLTRKLKKIFLCVLEHTKKNTGKEIKICKYLNQNHQ